jgi:hypothetical protein
MRFFRAEENGVTHRIDATVRRKNKRRSFTTGTEIGPGGRDSGDGVCSSMNLFARRE